MVHSCQARRNELPTSGVVSGVAYYGGAVLQHAPSACKSGVSHVCKAVADSFPVNMPSASYEGLDDGHGRGGIRFLTFAGELSPDISPARTAVDVHAVFVCIYVCPIGLCNGEWNTDRIGSLAEYGQYLGIGFA